MSRRVMLVLCTLCLCYTIITLVTWLLVTTVTPDNNPGALSSGIQHIARDRRHLAQQQVTHIPFVYSSSSLLSSSVLRAPPQAAGNLGTSTKPGIQTHASMMLRESVLDEEASRKNRWVFNYTSKQSNKPVIAIKPSSMGDELRMLEFDIKRRYRSNASRPIEQAISVHLVGGVGNIMFQYATLLGTSKALSKMPFLEYSARSAYLLNFFNMTSANVLTKAQHEEFLTHSHRFHERAWGRYDTSIRKIRADDIYLAGFFQSWKYFDDAEIKKRLRVEYELNEENMLAAKVVVHKIRKEAWESGAHGNVTLIGVHARRGDYLTKPGWRVPSAEYFLRAISLMQEQFNGNVVFILVSDDIQWCREQLVPRTHANIYISEQSSHMVDFGILTLCDHHVLSVGSFGWWAAWLAGGKVIYYRDWVANELQFYYNERDYFLPDWQGVDDREILEAYHSGKLG